MSVPSTPSNPPPSAPSTGEPSVPAPAGGAPSPGQRPGGGRPYGRPHGGPGGRPGGGPGGRPYGGPGGRGPGGRGRGPIRRKVCRFCAEKIFEVDYKQVHILRSFMTVRGKILSGRTTGCCARHQRQLDTAIKRAQNIALLPTTGE